MIDQLAALWSQGKALSAIAKSLGVSRGKVAGAIDRERKAGNSRFRSRPPPPTKARVVRPADENIGNRRARPAAQSTPPRPKLLIDLRPGQCLWPVGLARRRTAFIL